MTGVGGSADVADDSPAVRLVAADLDAGPFSFGRAPEGWVLQAHDSSRVSFTPADQPFHPDNFVDNLTVFVDRHGPDGREVSIGDRTYLVYQEGESTNTFTWSTYDHSGDPAVKLVVQFPDDLGWDEATMREFVAAADVTGAADPGEG